MLLPKRVGGTIITKDGTIHDGKAGLVNYESQSFRPKQKFHDSNRHGSPRVFEIKMMVTMAGPVYTALITGFPLKVELVTGSDDDRRMVERLRKVGSISRFAVHKRYRDVRRLLRSHGISSAILSVGKELSVSKSMHPERLNQICRYHMGPPKPAAFWMTNWPPVGPGYRSL